MLLEDMGLKFSEEGSDESSSLCCSKWNEKACMELD